MSNTKNLHNAKKQKKDEFYTLYEDIEKELQHYPEQLKDKIIYCNCDDYENSNFYKYFKDNFNKLQLKELIATGYDINTKQGKYAKYNGSVEYTNNNFNGDFKANTDLLKYADIIITNPPFSLFREYFKLLVEYNKKFLIIGNMNAITFKEIFPLIKDNKLWWGYSIHSGDREFRVPDNYTLEAAGCRVDDGGNKFIRVKGVRWFTNIEHKKRNDELILYKQYSEDYYPKYENYDAIEVSKTCEIPMDYDGVMGVPITFFDKYNPKQFEILGYCAPAISLKKLKNKGKFTEYKSRQILLNGILCQNTYFRILIRRKK